MARTHSSRQGVAASRKLIEAARQFKKLMAARNPFRQRNFSPLLADLRLYDELCRTYIGKPLSDCRALEIGFGSRPYRLFTLHAAGVDVTGVDMDEPLLSASDLIPILKRNGFWRAAKSAARYGLADIWENRQLSAFLATLGAGELDTPRERLKVMDAASPEFWAANPGPYELVYSDDVFEHIPEADLIRLVELMAEAIPPQGIAVISPMIFTGIKGGHYVEYYGYSDGPAPQGVPPWDHLRQRTVDTNTYLNELPRAPYEAIFREHFDILDETEVTPGLGRNLMNDSLRSELGAYDERELFSNKVRFVLRPRK